MSEHKQWTIPSTTMHHQMISWYSWEWLKLDRRCGTRIPGSSYCRWLRWMHSSLLDSHPSDVWTAYAPWGDPWGRSSVVPQHLQVPSILCNNSFSKGRNLSLVHSTIHTTNAGMEEMQSFCLEAISSSVDPQCHSMKRIISSTSSSAHIFTLFCARILVPWRISEKHVT